MLTSKIASLAGLRCHSLAGVQLSTVGGIQVGHGRGAIAVGWDRQLVDVVH